MHFSTLWVEQCDATEEIRERYGLVPGPGRPLSRLLGTAKEERFL